MLGERA
jgi:hypothetical protein